jgi:hypothetical protein
MIEHPYRWAHGRVPTQLDCRGADAAVNGCGCMAGEQEIPVISNYRAVLGLRNIVRNAAAVDLLAHLPVH